MKNVCLPLCLILLLVMLAGCGSAIEANEVNTEHDTLIETANDSAVKDTVFVVSSYEIETLSNSDTTDMSSNDSEGLNIPINPDSPLVSDTLKAALEDPELDGALFDVWIYILFNTSDIHKEFSETFLYQGKTTEQWHNKYIIALRARENYKMQLHSQLKNVPHFDKWSGSTKEAIALEVQWDSEWQVMWESEHPGELYPMTASVNAGEAAQAEWLKIESAFLESELLLIAEAGISLAKVPDENLYAAVLTKQQIQSFPAGNNITGYTIIFAGESDCTFGGLSLNNDD